MIDTGQSRGTFVYSSSLAGLQLVHIPSLYNVLRVLVIAVDKVSQDFQSRKSN